MVPFYGVPPGSTHPPFNSVIASLGAAAPRSAWITTLLTSIARCREALPRLSLGPSGLLPEFQRHACFGVGDEKKLSIWRFLS
jgi:hypothetical protein